MSAALERRSLIQETIAGSGALLGVAALSVACASDDAPARSARDGGTDRGTGGVVSTGGTGGTGAGGSSVPSPKLDSLPPGWTTIRPGGDTLCAYGTPFQFFVRPGTVNRVLIEFSGTGACWDEASCGPGSGLFKSNANGDLFILDEDVAAGVRDHQDVRNFYTVESGGVKIADWIAQIVADQPVSNITCGDQCDALATAGGPP